MLVRCSVRQLIFTRYLGLNNGLSIVQPKVSRLIALKKSSRPPPKLIPAKFPLSPRARRTECLSAWCAAGCASAARRAVRTLCRTRRTRTAARPHGCARAVPGPRDCKKGTHFVNCSVQFILTIDCNASYSRRTKMTTRLVMARKEKCHVT